MKQFTLILLIIAFATNADGFWWKNKKGTAKEEKVEAQEETRGTETVIEKVEPKETKREAERAIETNQPEKGRLDRMKESGVHLIKRAKPSTYRLPENKSPEKTEKK